MNHNILIVSEKDQKAYLPYRISDIEKVKKEYPNLSQDEIINLYFVVSLDKYKYSSISRFRETMNLVLNKEHLSFFSALELSLELIFNYKLNPIIISACRNLDELNIYLDCLQEDELFDFDCFDIKFEVSPLVYIKSIFKSKNKNACNF